MVDIRRLLADCIEDQIFRNLLGLYCFIHANICFTH